MQDLRSKIYNNEILLNNSHISIVDIFYAVKEEIFSPDIIKQYIFQTIKINSPDYMYDIFNSNSTDEAFFLLETELHNEKKINKNELQHSMRLIRFFVLKNILSKKRNTILEEIALLYEDMGYPEDMENFIYYMPNTECYDSGKHTKEENANRLLLLAENFLYNEKKILNC